MGRVAIEAVQIGDKVLSLGGEHEKAAVDPVTGRRIYLLEMWSSDGSDDIKEIESLRRLT